MSSWNRVATTVFAFLAMTATGLPQTPEAYESLTDYFDEPPPGDLPVMFAPGIASTDLHDDWPPVFTPDGSEVILRVVGPAKNDHVTGSLLHSVREGEAWQPPVPLWFSNQFLEVEGFPAMSPDGSRLFVSTARAEWKGQGEPDRDIWVFQRVPRGWDEPERVGPSVNSDMHDLVTCVGSDGTLYFDREPRTGEWFSKTYYAKPDASGGYQDPVELLIPGSLQFTKVCISPDDGYLVMTGFHSTRSLDLYVSFKTGDDTWGEPVNLESINSPFSDKFPVLSHDGHYLFFASRRTPTEQTPPRLWDATEIQPAPRGNQVDVYWVSTAVIERLRP